MSALFAAYGFLTLSSLWGEAGWPANHEYQSFAVRLQIYVQRFKLGDVLPFWSSTDNDGLGSPQPLFYHKLYYLLAASISVATGASSKAALVSSVLLFLVVGALGISALVRDVGGSRLAGVGAGLVLISANYTVTNWLVRGALAEFSAAQLVPWALLYFQRGCARSRAWWPLGLVLGLVFLAHSVLCCYLILLFAAVVLVLTVTGRLRLVRQDLGAAALAAAAALLAAGPYVAGLIALHGEYDMSRLLVPPYRPTLQFHPLHEYVFDRSWRWGERWDAYTVQLDLPLTCTIAGALFVAALTRPAHAWRRQTLAASGLLHPLGLVAASAAVLQMRISAPFYELVPGAAYLQFPWRLLGVLTPIVASCAVLLVERVLSARLARLALIACVAATVAASGAWAPIQYGRLAVAAGPPGPITLGCCGEYLPRRMPSPAPSNSAVIAAAERAGCALKREQPLGVEVTRVRFRARCASDGFLPLPLVGSALHRVTVTKAGVSAAPTSCESRAGHDGLCAVRLPSGESIVDVELPRLRWLSCW